MPLYIKDPHVTELAETLRRLTRAPSKTDAVRVALERAIEATTNQIPLATRLRDAVAIARRIGPTNAAFDQKAFSDAMWGEDDVH